MRIIIMRVNSIIIIKEFGHSAFNSRDDQLVHPRGRRSTTRADVKVSIFSAKKKNEKNEPKNFLEMARIYGPRAFLDGLCSFCPLLAPRCIYFHHNTSRGSFFSY
jgi:hypothetical protein